MDLVYLDNAATTPLIPEVRDTLVEHLDRDFGNPSTRYSLGVRAAETLERARRRLGRALGAQPEDVVLTAGGSEANNLAVLGAARRGGPGKVFCGPTEHASTRASTHALAAEGFEVHELPLDATGTIDIDAAVAQFDESTRVVSLMLVNNELGTRYPVEELFREARRRAPRAHLHIDAVQALGKEHLSLETLGADSIAISAHKVHGPKGMGALGRRSGVRLVPLILGGPQEGGLRAGTENVASAAAFGLAAKLADQHVEDFQRSARECRAALDRALEPLDQVKRLEPGHCVDSICTLQVSGAPGEVWQHHLEAHGVCVGVGSACQAKSREISPGLRALGLDADAAGHVLRISFSRLTQPADVTRLGAALAAVAGELAGAVR